MITLILAIIALVAFFSLQLYLLLKLSAANNSTGESRNSVKRREINRAVGKDQSKRRPVEQKDKFHAIDSCAFFHPNCSAGGGGERTLWAAVLAVKSHNPLAKIAVYIKAGPKDQGSIAEIRQKVLKDFNLEISDDLRLIPLRTVFLAESSTYPRLTLLGQIVGSWIVGLEALLRFKPKTLIDTAGFPFIYPVFKLFTRCKVVAYVHYPFISRDMLERIQTKSYNNSGLIASNYYLRRLKLQYYRSLASIYAFAGQCCDLALTNSTWTTNHMLRLWKRCDRIQLIYPPCDLTAFSQLSLQQHGSSQPLQVLSLGQFRPEKNHRLQLEIAALFLKMFPESQFILIGGCRDEEDLARVEDLKRYAAETLRLPPDSVSFKVNLPFDELLPCLTTATIGLHTMLDEHFGIGIAELMAAGLITCANNSGGPRADIIRPARTGFLCSSAPEYAAALAKIAKMTSQDRLAMATRARGDILARFNAKIFAEKFVSELGKVLNK